MKYTSDYTTLELIQMGYIDKLIIPLVKFFAESGFNTNGSCEGHINDHGNCEYTWIDFTISDLPKLIELLKDYDKRYEILIQLRNDDTFIKK